MVNVLIILLLLIGFTARVSGQSRNIQRVNYYSKSQGENDATEQVHHPEKLHALIEKLVEEKNLKIKIKEAKISTTLNARPTLASIFKKRENRTYIIRVNNKKNFKGIYNHQVPAEAQEGLWAHELMHIIDYHDKNFLGILKRGFQYLTSKGRMAFEHEIDTMTIHHGFGEELYKWAVYIMEDSPACERYKAYKRAIYLNPLQILNLVENLEPTAYDI